MSFEALSCAMAHVIINYHAQQKDLSLLTSSDEDTLENILDCETSDIDSVLRTKIDEATTGTNSSRLTLLQYMHFGISLAQRAEKSNTLEDIQKHHLQLIQFMQNLQKLLTTTSFWSRTLDVTAHQDKVLSIPLLSYTTAKAKNLLSHFFKTIGLSPESKENTINEHITHCFGNKALFIENNNLKAKHIDLHKNIDLLKAKYNALAQRQLKSFEQPLKTKPLLQDECEVEDFQYISLESNTEKANLIAENAELSKLIAKAERYKDILENLIKKCENGSSNEHIEEDDEEDADDEVDKKECVTAHKNLNKKDQKQPPKKQPKKDPKSSKTATVKNTSTLHQRKPKAYASKTGNFFSGTTTKQPTSTKNTQHNEPQSSRKNSGIFSADLSSLFISVMNLKPEDIGSDDEKLAKHAKCD